MEKIETPCPSCSPDTPVSHVILKSTEELLLQCEECRSVHRAAKPRQAQVRVIVSKGKESLHRRALLSGMIKTGDEMLIDDETTGEADLVQVTSIEVGDKRKERAAAEDIKTLWARAVDNVTVKISIPRREITESIEMLVPGDREFVVGEKLRVNNRELKIIKIKIRNGGFKSRKGTSITAKDIRRIYTQPETEKPRKISRGKRVKIKKRESVWSLKHRGTD